jgi:hypothetical protein
MQVDARVDWRAIITGRSVLPRRNTDNGAVGEFPRVGRIVLGVAGGNPLKLTRVGHDHFMTQPFQLPADPSRLRSRFQRNPPRQPAEMLCEGTHLITETAFFDDLAFSVHDAAACTSSSALHSLSLSKAGQPSHPIYFGFKRCSNA